VTLKGGDYDGRTPLHLASCNGLPKVVAYLLGVGVEVNPKDRWGATPLDDSPSDLISKILLKFGGERGGASDIQYWATQNNLVTEEEYCLLYSAYENNLNLLQSLLINIDVNATDYDNRTALGIAASEGHMESVQYLLNHGANVLHVDARGNNALQDAKRENRYDVV